MRRLPQRIEAGETVEGIAGVGYKEDGRLKFNAPRALRAIAELPPKAYHLSDFDAYERATGERKLPYATSIGCPYACNFCTDMVFYNRRFNAYGPEEVVADLARLAKKYRVTEVCLLDSNFLVDVRRASAIAQGIIESGARFRWTFQGSTAATCNGR